VIRLRVKEVAQQKGISQGKLSRSSDVDIKTLQKIYRQPTSIVTTETLDKLATALGVDVRELLESVSNEDRQG
jgi:DNA-binding Xre family transcriptional regulator